MIRARSNEPFDSKDSFGADDGAEDPNSFAWIAPVVSIESLDSNKRLESTKESNQNYI